MAIYDHQMNSSITIDLEKLLKLDDSKYKQVVFLSTLLYTSLAISVAVAAVAMVAKLWIIRYKHELLQDHHIYVPGGGKRFTTGQSLGGWKSVSKPCLLWP